MAHNHGVIGFNAVKVCGFVFVEAGEEVHLVDDEWRAVKAGEALLKSDDAFQRRGGAQIGEGDVGVVFAFLNNDTCASGRYFTMFMKVQERGAFFDAEPNGMGLKVAKMACAFEL